MVKLLNSCPYAKKGYGTLSKGGIFLPNPVYLHFFKKCCVDACNHSVV